MSTVFHYRYSQYTTKADAISNSNSKFKISSCCKTYVRFTDENFRSIGLKCSACGSDPKCMGGDCFVNKDI